MLINGALMRFRFGQVLTRTKATLSGFRLVRNLSESHARQPKRFTFASERGLWAVRRYKMENRDVRAELERWIANVSDEELAAELAEMKKAADAGDDSAAVDAFFQDLAFGTAGLRGTLGAGTNRMNIYTVGRATQGFADYLNANFENPSVAIARDSRNKGELFVQVTASILAANGIVAHVYPKISPVPTLSFAVRDLGCSGGICMTASHNPAAYNGYKAYGPDGCQITSEAAKAISASIANTDAFSGVKTMGFDEAVASGMVKWIDDAVLERIGRRHTAADFFRAVDEAHRVGFDCLNAALIAGLPGDTRERFAQSLSDVLGCGFENVTVHTLSIKNASPIRFSDESVYDAEGVFARTCVDYAYERLSGEGYAPYYFYRQKNTVGNAENTGYSKVGAEGIYNILMMEEYTSVFACGAGAITKLVSPDKQVIERLAHPKYPFEYLGLNRGLRTDEVRNFYGRYF